MCVFPSGGDVAETSARAAVNGACAMRALRCRSEASELRYLARLREVRGDDASVADEVALELGYTRRSAQNRVALANALVTYLPHTLAALESGVTDVRAAQKVFEATLPLSEELAGEVDRRLANRFAGKDPSEVRRVVRDLVHRVDSDGAAERARKRRDDRHVELISEDDAMSTLSMYLPAEVAAAAYTRIDRIARGLRNGGEERFVDQLRADVAADLLLGKGSGGGVHAQVWLHVPLDAAFGVTDRGCELAGHGPIPATIARQIMHNPSSVWRRITTDPVSGAPIDVGRTRYRPPAALRAFVQVRDRECRMPGCHRPAQVCDADHAVDFHRNGGKGRTSTSTMQMFCEHHHYLKDRPGWCFRLNEITGELTITTPAGRHHINKPDPLCPPVEKTDERPSTKDEVPVEKTNGERPPPF